MNAIAAINIAKKSLKIEEDDYRAMLLRVTGKASLKLMTSVEHGLVLDALGGKVTLKTKRQLDGPYGAKLQALWLSGWNLGVVRDRTDAALLSFVKGQTGIEHTRFLRNSADARKAVEALKSWLGRAGVDWSLFADPKDCVIQAQGQALGWTQSVCDIPGVIEWCMGDVDSKTKVALMQRLGTRIRAKASKSHER
ncbi:MAG TPA: regulatory protein GemA [Devosia sp.]|nr:regulatory protein GemA [Devosia sp.]